LFKSGDWVIYVGRDPRYSDSNRIGSVGRVVAIRGEEDDATIGVEFYQALAAPGADFRYYGSAAYCRVYPDNVELFHDPAQ
jgi:hypothetical protein